MVRAKGKFDKKPKIKRKKLIFKNTLRKIKNKNRIKDNIKIIIILNHLKREYH